MKFIKTFESYSLDEFEGEVTSLLTDCNLRPIEIQKLLDFYSSDIEDVFNSGQYPKLIADKIKKELELGNGGYPSIILPKQNITQIKYL